MRKRKYREETPISSTSTSASGSKESETSPERERRHRSDKRRRREKEKRRDSDGRRRRRREREERDRSSRKKTSRRKSRKSKDSDSESGSEDLKVSRVGPEDVVSEMLKEFPNVGNDLTQLLQMVDHGQAVDIKGISERLLIKHLKKLFISLHLKDNGDNVFLKPAKVRPTLEVVGLLIQDHLASKQQQVRDSIPTEGNHPVSPDARRRTVEEEHNSPVASPDDVGPRRRVIGPEMPSAELLAAAAKLTEAQEELRETELEEDDELFIGPPPPAAVAEAESANEAERFEEVTRIMEVEGDSPYDVVGVNRKMSSDNLKKRYWKLSLLVHPDKCSHPLAQQAFVKLNSAFKELQDPDKRKLLDDKLIMKEEEEQFKAELRAMREAAQWRKLQGISMEGDDELLAQTEVKEAEKRDEWMTTLPPERKPGMTMQSSKFSKSSKDGRGDTSVWTDTPMDRVQKAKTNYLEAYNETVALAAGDDGNKQTKVDAELVDKYNKAKRSKSLVQKHQEETTSKSKKKSKKQPEKEEEWSGQHPWRPWDREKDLTAGRQKVNLDSDNMAQGLTSRFSSGNFQRNFL